MNHHGAVAEEIGTEIETGRVAVVPCGNCGRQGDVIVTRSGDSEGAGESLGSEGRCIASGDHGEHRLLADSATVTHDGDAVLLDLPSGGVLVHTDVPAARHAPIHLSPGRWIVEREQELDLSGAVVEVRD